jgi:hypothetical protein
MQLAELQNLQHAVSRLEKQNRCLSLGLLALAFLYMSTLLSLRAGSADASSAQPTSALRVRELVIVDQHGIERVRMGAPLPEPITLGKRYRRGGSSVSGVLLYDSEGNERSGYVTDDREGNVFISLDDVARQHVLLFSPRQGGGFLRFFDKDNAVEMGVTESASNLRVTQGGKVIFQQPPIAENP